MILLPNHKADELFVLMCGNDSNLLSEWRRAIAVGEETRATRNLAISVGCKALALAKFVSEREREWFSDQLLVLLAQLKTGRQKRLAREVVEAARNRKSRFDGLIDRKTVTRRLREVESGFNCIVHF